MDDEQDHSQEEADGAHSDVGNAEEGVLPSHPGDGAQDHPLATIKAEHRVIWLHMVKETWLDNCFTYLFLTYPELHWENEQYREKYQVLIH